MAENVKELNEQQLDEAIAAGAVLVDFWAPWCGPCKMQLPILEQVAGKVDGKAIVAKINIDEHDGAAAKYSVQSIPTLILFKDGEAVKRFVGVQQENTLVSAIEDVC
jgi:thioredoxin 1